LKDGASAIYGADAIGGVINFITRRDYAGGEISGGYGITDRGDGAERSASATAGFGDYSSQGFNVLANVNWFKRGIITNLDRERTRTADYRRFTGNGQGNQMSTYAPSGNVQNPTTKNWEPYTPCPSADLLVTPSPLGSGTSCVFDFAPYRPTYSPSERKSAFVSGSLKLADNHRLFAEALYSENDTSLSAAPAPAAFVIPASHPSNHYGQAVTVRGRPLQAGPRTTDNESKATRFVVGVDGNFGNYDYSVAVGQAKNKSVNNDGGYFLADKLYAAIANGTFDPFATNNSQAVMDTLNAHAVRRGETTYEFVEGKLSGELIDLPAGPLGFAVGVVAAKEKLNDQPSKDQVAGNIFGSIAQSPAVGSRESKAVYSELAVPILKNLEAQLALRYDSYQGGTNSTTPKVALRFQPVQSLLLRASYSEGFKMPSLRDLFGGQNQSADSVQDFPGCDARNITAAKCPRLQYDRYSGGNPQLKPEESKSMNFGFVFEPSRNFNLGVDYFIIKKTDEIGLVPTQYVLDHTPYAAGTFTSLPGSPLLGVKRDAGGTVVNIQSGQANLGTRNIKGFDFTNTVRFKAMTAAFSLGTDVTYYQQYDYSDLPGTAEYGRLGLLNLPRYKVTLNGSMDVGATNARIIVTHLPHMLDKPDSTASAPATAADKMIASFTTVDVAGSYKGFKDLTLGLGVKNLFDREPPFANNDTRTLGFAQVHDIRGRYYYGNVSYKFK
ncbi:TonB-dependent receptor domain-containing protein, partial [Chitinimonas sp.]|uniref:TonB-dependent receptor domain-containing protein n=1 Tax=Chitinimonas sp. TaxID=1934313 RepID=UPI002F924596